MKRLGQDGRWRDGGKFTKPPRRGVYLDERTGRHRDAATKRFVKPPKPPKPKGRIKAERTEAAIEDAWARKLSRQARAYWRRVRKVADEEKISTKEAQRLIKGSLGSGFDSARERVLRKYHFRRGYGYKYVDGIEVPVTSGEVYAAKQSAMFNEYIWRVSVRRGISYAQAKERVSSRTKEMQEEFDKRGWKRKANWKDTINKELYGGRKRHG